MTAVMQVPLGSVDPCEWLVYADFASDYPSKALYTEDKARRIAFALTHWQGSILFSDIAITAPALWLRLSRGSRGWPAYKWYWDTYPSPYSSTMDPTASNRPAKDQYTNPEVSSLCKGNAWYSVKFFNYMLTEPVLRSCLSGNKYEEYRKTFDRLHETATLREQLHSHQNCNKFRRVRWTRGEYLEILERNFDHDGVTGVAKLVNQAANYRLNKPWQLRLRRVDLLDYLTKHDVCLTLSGSYTSRYIRPLAKDWVKHE